MNRLEEDFSRRWFVDRSAVAFAVENNVRGDSEYDGAEGVV